MISTKVPWLALSALVVLPSLGGCSDAEEGSVEMSVIEPGPGGGPTLKSTHTLSAEQYRSLVAQKTSLMERAAALEKAGLSAIEQAQFLLGSPGSTTSAVPGEPPCTGLDIWVYDISNGWTSGPNRHIGCFRNPTESSTGCTNFSVDNLSSDPLCFEGCNNKVWASELRSLWGGPCRAILNFGPNKTVQMNAWAQVNVTPPWSSLNILDH